MSNIKSKSSRQLSNKCHRPSICFRIPDTVVLSLCIKYTSLLYGGRFSILNCISASLFLFPTSSTFTTVHTHKHSHTRVLCLGFTLSKSNFLYPDSLRLMNGGLRGGLLSGFSFVFQLIYRSIDPKSAFCIVLAVSMPVALKSYLQSPPSSCIIRTHIKIPSLCIVVPLIMGGEMIFI